ncbi:MAG: hypothetical protein FWD82_05595 [Defluviitaleaceae bacterium]|nr:hypothetical protein [Defluviitaleaceae bacterium]
MAKTEYQFSDFLTDVSDGNKDFVIAVHEMLTKDNYKFKIESKASGFLVSYAHPKTKHSILNFAFRKNGMYIRLYGANCNNYAELLNRLPKSMIAQIDKSGNCSRMLNPQACNSRCAMGYDFYIGENHYQKCRIVCFFLLVDGESIPFLLEMVEREKQARA